MELNILNWTA